MDHAVRRPWLIPAPRAAADEAPALPAPAPRPRRLGPVLMGDLTASLGGRPLLLFLWDEPGD